jgi:hypothetical protein
MSRVWRLDGDGDGKGDGGYRLRWSCWCGEQGVTKVRHGQPPDQADQAQPDDGPPEMLSAS